ncbi:unnamed protein product [Protopolystoma xenopodis]|uniref:Uncharacterized protein n=1 Tax=Protopolystoma xenopodis TaxID=117903 RepID=A0A3S4ZUJ0_9PLAT|nr:unnamed protein product [Protopolystoma xenopodis]
MSQSRPRRSPFPLGQSSSHGLFSKPHYRLAKLLPLEKTMPPVLLPFTTSLLLRLLASSKLVCSTHSRAASSGVPAKIGSFFTCLLAAGTNYDPFPSPLLPPTFPLLYSLNRSARTVLRYPLRPALRTWLSAAWSCNHAYLLSNFPQQAALPVGFTVPLLCQNVRCIFRFYVIHGIANVDPSLVENGSLLGRRMIL